MTADEMTYTQQSVGMPKFLRNMLAAEAAKNARTLTGEIVFRLAQSFGIMPDGSAATSPHISDAPSAPGVSCVSAGANANAGDPGVTAGETASKTQREVKA